jgi:hypothetical protein
MTRALHALQYSFVVLTLLLFGTVAQAGPQQKVSVLGIEAVAGADGQINPADTNFAKELTKELRSRVNNSKNYTLSKDTRELVDEKLMGSCGSEQPQCMGPIGTAVGADVLLFGKVANTKGGGYAVTLTLVDAKKRAKINSDSGTVSASEVKNPGLGNWVREHYRKLTNENVDGTLVIIAAGAGDGRVFIGTDTKEKLRSGRAEITLPEGRYKVGVEADGFKLWESETITIAAGERQELRPDLVKAKPLDTKVPDPNENKDTTTGTQDLISREGTVTTTKRNKLPWKIAAGVGLGGAAVFGGLWAYQWFGPIKTYKNNNTASDYILQDDPEVIKQPARAGEDVSVGAGDCDKGHFRDDTKQRDFRKACDAYDRTQWLVPTTIGLAVIGAGALVYLMVSKDGTEERPAGAGRQQRRKKNFIVTPVVSPDGTGATLRFDW